MSDFNPDEIYAKVSQAGEEWADKKSAYEALDDNTKSVLADIIADYMDTQLTRSESETRALASSVYKDHLAQKQAARRAWLKATVLYDSLKMLAELRRSEESTKRAEMQIR